MFHEIRPDTVRMVFVNVYFKTDENNKTVLLHTYTRSRCTISFMDHNLFVMTDTRTARE